MFEFKKPTAKEYLGAYIIQAFEVSPDDSKLIMSANLNGAFNLWAIDLETSYYPYPLTNIGQSTSFIKFDPKGRYILAGFDKDGDENYKIYALPLIGGELTPLFEESKGQDKYYFSHLNEKGELLYYVSSKENPTYLNGYVYDIEKKQERRLYEGSEGATYLAAVSDDDTRFVIIKVFANTYALAMVMTETETLPLVPEPQKIHITRSPLFVDKNTIYFLTDYESDFTYLAMFLIKDKAFRKILEIPDVSFVEAKFHRESSSIILQAEKGVEDLLYRFYLDGQRLEEIPLPVSVVDQLEVSKKGTIYVLGRSATTIHNIYRLVEGREWQPITQNKLPGIPKELLVEPEVLEYTSFDGKRIQALFFKPPADIDNGYTVLWPHGGPQAAERKFFRPFFQLLLAYGYRIFAPNFRGSTGYGKTFTQLVERDWGEGPRKDIIAGIDWLIETGKIDKDKIFVVGGSYGGYMTLLLHGRHADKFKAFVDIFGVSNLITFAESVPPHWKPMMERALGDPVKDKERLIKDSPITYLENMTKPMLVVQGANDPRVVKAESDQIVEALRSKGRDVEYIVLPDEGHGFSKKSNEIKVYTAILDFLDRHK